LNEGLPGSLQTQPRKQTLQKILAGYSGVTDDELLDIAYDVYILRILSKVPYPGVKG
jgi:hypothetical protein